MFVLKMSVFKFFILLTWFFIFATASLNGNSINLYFIFKFFLFFLENESKNQRKCHETVFGTSKFEDKENIVDKIQLQMREIQLRIDRLDRGVSKAEGGKHIVGV